MGTPWGQGHPGDRNGDRDTLGTGTGPGTPWGQEPSGDKSLLGPNWDLSGAIPGAAFGAIFGAVWGQLGPAGASWEPGGYRGALGARGGLGLALLGQVKAERDGPRPWRPRWPWWPRRWPRWPWQTLPAGRGHRQRQLQALPLRREEEEAFRGDTEGTRRGCGHKATAAGGPSRRPPAVPSLGTEVAPRAPKGVRGGLKGSGMSLRGQGCPQGPLKGLEISPGSP